LTDARGGVTAVVNNGSTVRLTMPKSVSGGALIVTGDDMATASHEAS